MTELLNCPFCGGEGKVNTLPGIVSSVCIKCRDCGANSRLVNVSSKHCAEDVAVAAWNRRHKEAANGE